MDELCKGMSQTGSSIIATDKTQENNGSMVYVNDPCLECERVRAACERLGSVVAVSVGQGLPTLTSPAYFITSPFEGDLFDAAHKAKYRDDTSCELNRHLLEAYPPIEGISLIHREEGTTTIKAGDAFANLLV
ncbi:unnamed protein product [Pieris macdunnoughi]|uniref:Uncharacterized protein n=1 Tax=Pieris macdunnoughi TaxID=345717 RepID=A0A821TWZ9_9NEOP|nr:unnamed protein product [Pieris macdunnoughi]